MHVLASPEDVRLTLPDGRSLNYRRFGAHAGPLVLALHGTPGSRLKFSAMHEPALALGWQIIAPDRWAYGMSDAPARPSLARYAEDMDWLADRLKLDRFSVIGVSGGGPYAAAVAARLGARVSALGLISPVGPIAGHIQPGQMSRFHRFCFNKLQTMPALTSGAFSLLRLGLTHAPDLALRVATSNTPAADRAILAHADVRTRLAATFAEGLRGGVKGPLIDVALFSRPWQVDLQKIQARTRLWIGTEDRNVPIAAALGLARHIQGCDVTSLPGAGHLWIALHYQDVLNWLVDPEQLQAAVQT